MACQKLKDRMATVVSNLQGAKWHELVTILHFKGFNESVYKLGFRAVLRSGKIWRGPRLMSLTGPLHAQSTCKTEKKLDPYFF